MSATGVMNIRIDPQLKTEFETFCNEVGVTMSTAINMLIKQTVKDQRITVGRRKISATEKLKNKTMTEIEKLKDALVKELAPEQIWLFGSFAKGTPREDSDIDLYIVMNNNVSNDELFDIMGEAHGVCRHAKATKRPLDILAGTLKMFEDGKNDTGFVEREIHRTGVKIYDRKL